MHTHAENTVYINMERCIVKKILFLIIGLQMSFHREVLLEVTFVGWGLWGIDQHIAVTITGLAIRTGYERGNGERARNQHQLNWDFEFNNIEQPLSRFCGDN